MGEGGNKEGNRGCFQYQRLIRRMSAFTDNHSYNSSFQLIWVGSLVFQRSFKSLRMGDFPLVNEAYLQLNCITILWCNYWISWVLFSSYFNVVRFGSIIFVYCKMPNYNYFFQQIPYFLPFSINIYILKSKVKNKIKVKKQKLVE